MQIGDKITFNSRAWNELPSINLHREKMRVTGFIAHSKATNRQYDVIYEYKDRRGEKISGVVSHVYVTVVEEPKVPLWKQTLNMLTGRGRIR